MWLPTVNGIPKRTDNSAKGRIHNLPVTFTHKHYSSPGQAAQSRTDSQCKTHRPPTYLILPDVFWIIAGQWVRHRPLIASTKRHKGRTQNVLLRICGVDGRSLSWRHRRSCPHPGPGSLTHRCLVNYYCPKQLISRNPSFLSRFSSRCASWK